MSQIFFYSFHLVLLFSFVNFFFFFSILNRLRQAVLSCPEALPNFSHVQEVFDYEVILKYALHGSTAEIPYERFKALLRGSTLSQSLDSDGIVCFKTVFPVASRSSLHVPSSVKLPYPFLAKNINCIIDYLPTSGPAIFSMETCVERLILITGSFSRQLCGLNVVEPTKATLAFAAKRINRLKSNAVAHSAVFEGNMLDVGQVSNF